MPVRNTLLLNFFLLLAPTLVLSQDPLELLIQEKIDAMTVQEKIAQIHRNSFWTSADNEDLDIPGLVMSDGPHGVRLIPATSFPTGIAIAASWNKDLAYEIGRAMGREFHAYGKHQQLGPTLDLCRDPRNGRSPESGGEDPFLCAHMNVGLVKGIQESPVIATVKHFNAVNRQVDRHNVNHELTQRQLMEHYGYNFRRVIQDAGPLSVMNAYNRVNGDKCAESSNLLDHILRERWGFPFYVVSDWGSIFDGQNALQAGCDLEMSVETSVYEQVLLSLYNADQITDDDLNRAVRRVLRVKYLTGMMDNMPLGSPFSDANTPEHQQLAREAGHEAIVLLKNDGDILPITDTNINIALIGPSAQIAQLDGFGSSWVDPPYSVSPYEGLLEYVNASQIDYVMGCEINSQDSSQFAAARTAAAEADLVIFVGGLDPTQEGENYWPGPVDRTGGSVELPGMQQALIAALAEENENIITVIKSGGICAVPDVVGDIKGFLYAFYPGMEGGHAIADVIFGTVNPSGKLPVTMPVNDAQMPDWNDDFSDDFNCGYRYYDELDLTPQFAFGFGLSYTTFSYSNFVISNQAPEAGSPVTFTVDVENTGARPGAEVVQLYLSNYATDMLTWMPEKELKGFEKVYLEPGETQTVSFTLTANEMYYFDTNTDAYEVAVGDYAAHVGGASDALFASLTFSTVAATPLPDLEVTRIYSFPRFPQPGDSVLFTALVKNQGTVNFTPDMPLSLTFEIDGVQVSSSTSISDTIYAGGALLITATEGANGTPLWVPVDDGVYEVSATVDADGSYAEWIEDNNSLMDEIIVEDNTGPIVQNLCYLKPVTSTSNESPDLGAENAVDGAFHTRWSSAFSDPQELEVDLLDTYHLDQVTVVWESAHSSEYRIEVSENGADYIEIAYEANADGGIDVFYPDINARYIRLVGLARATEWGHSLFEVQAFGDLVTGMEEEEAIDFQIYPNPARDSFTLADLPANELLIVSVIDSRGRVVLNRNTIGKTQLNLRHNGMTPGIYVVQVRGNEFHRSKLIKIE